MRRFTTELADGAMAGIEFGDASARLAAVWIHATGFNAATYQSILEPLGTRTRVAAVDMRGHGLSTLSANPKELKSWKTYRNDTIAYLEATADGPVVLGGHSMGACVALLVAGKRPDLVSGLVLVDPVILNPRLYFYFHALPFVRVLMAGSGLAKGAAKRRSRFESRAKAAESYRGRGAFKTWRVPFLEDYLGDGLREVEGSDEVELSCAPAWEAATFSAQRNRPWKALRLARAADIPITVLRPEHNSVISSRSARRLIRKYPRIDLRQRRGTTHFLPMETPYEVRDCLTLAISRYVDGFAPGDEGQMKRSLHGTSVEP